jgi:hypothetical protein
VLLHSHTLSLREILIWGGRQGLKCGAIPLAHGTNGVNKMRSCFRPFSDCVGRLGPSLIPPAPICAIATLICLANGLAIKGQLSPAIATGGAPPVASKRYDALTTPKGRSDAACAVVRSRRRRHMLGVELSAHRSAYHMASASAAVPFAEVRHCPPQPLPLMV